MVAASTDVIVCENSDGSTPFMAFPIEWAVAEGMMSHLGVLDTEASSAAFSSCLMYIVDGVPVSGGADPTWTLRNAGPGDQGNYHVVASNLAGSAVSATASRVTVRSSLWPTINRLLPLCL